TARQSARELFQDADRCRRLANVPGNGRDLFLLHADRRVPLSHSAGWMASGRLDASSEVECHDLAAQCASKRCTQDAAVLADLVGPLLERVSGYRRDRHGFADAAGNLRWQADRTP